MQLRQQAKMGLQEMDAMGQMGNSDEATMDDDLPFGMADIMVVSAGGEPMEFADGGFVPTKNYAPGGLSTTRSLSPEIVAPARTKIDFKQLMGEAAIEFKEYRNAEGKSIMVAHIGGVAAFPIPEGYTLYVADDSIGNGDTSTDDIVADANNAAAEKAAAEKALADEPYNAGYSSTVTSASPAIDWENLSTKELLEELDKITGVSATIAKGAMAFLGLPGLFGYGLMRNRDKRAAKAAQARIAKGGLSSSELAALNKKVESLTTKSFALFGKVLENVGGTLGLTTENVEEIKKKAVVVEGQISDSEEAAVVEKSISVSPRSSTDIAYDYGTTAVPAANTQTAENPFGSPLPGPNVYASADGRFIVPSNNSNSVSNTNPTEVSESDTPTGLELQAQLAMNNQTDMRKRQSPVDMGITKKRDAFFRKQKTPEAYAAMRNKYSQELLDMFDDNDAIRNYQADSDASDSFNRQVNDGDFDGTILAPGEGKLLAKGSYPAPTAIDGPLAGFPAAPVDTQTEGFSTPTTPSYDKNGNPHPNAFSARAANAQIDASASIANAERILAENPISSGDKIPGVKENFELESITPFAPKMTTEVPNISDPRDYQGGAYGYGQTGVAPLATTPDPVVSFKPPEGAVPPLDVQPPVTVAEQTDQAFPNLTRGFGDGSNSVTPTTELTRGYGDGSNIATSPSSVTPTTESPRNYTDTAYNYGTTSLPTTAPTFNEKFATERLAGAKTFSYDRDGDGTMESYTTQTVEEASPAGSNSLYQSFVNLITPGDDKEYQGGKIVNTGSGKTTVKKKNNSAKNAIARLRNSNGGINVNTTDTAILGEVSNDGNWQEVVQPGTNAITRTWVGSDNDNNNSNDNSNEGSFFSGGGADNVGNFGAVGDFFGGITDALGITDYSNDSDTNAYKGGLLSKPKSKKKTKVTTKKRGLAARK